MPSTKHETRPPRARISCHHAGATEVFVAGTFNDWNPRASPMERWSDDDWEIDLKLPPGQYEYKFVIDGE